MARLRLQQAGVRSFTDCRRTLCGLIATQLFPRRARDETFVVEQASPQRAIHAGARPFSHCFWIISGLLKGGLFKMGSEIRLWHIVYGPSAIETSRVPILCRLSSDFMWPDDELGFSKTGSGLDPCHKASEPSANHSRKSKTLQRLLMNLMWSSEGVTFSRWVRRFASVISHKGRLRLQQAGV